MSTQVVCDECGSVISGTPLVTSTEKDGSKFEFDTAACFIAWRGKQDQ